MFWRFVEFVNSFNFDDYFVAPPTMIFRLNVTDLLVQIIAAAHRS
jgi:hypothetical protein